MAKLMPTLTVSCAVAVPAVSATIAAAINAIVNCPDRMSFSRLVALVFGLISSIRRDDRRRLGGGNARSQEPELAQLATQRLRHILGPWRSAVEVARGVFGREIAPALERPPRPRLDQGELGLEHQMAAADPFLVDEWPHVDEPLPAHDLAADHPVERAAVAQLVGALGHHARPVHVLEREPALPALLELLADPILEILDRVTADAKLDEMKGHGGYCRTKCDEIIARRACVATRARELILRRWTQLLRGSKRRRTRGCGARRRARLRTCLRRPAWRRRRRGLGRAGCVLGLPLRRRWFRGHDIDRRDRLR